MIDVTNSNSKILIKSCFFEKNSAEKGGAIFLKNSGNVTITKNIFFENKAKNGGAIFYFEKSIEIIINIF